MPITDAAFESLRERVGKLEQSHAVRDETLTGIRERLAKIEAILTRLTWIMITGIGGAFAAFIIAGGLRIPAGGF